MTIDHCDLILALSLSLGEYQLGVDHRQLEYISTHRASRDWTFCSFLAKPKQQHFALLFPWIFLQFLSLRWCHWAAHSVRIHSTRLMQLQIIARCSYSDLTILCFTLIHPHQTMTPQHSILIYCFRFKFKKLFGISFSFYFGIFFLL